MPESIVLETELPESQAEEPVHEFLTFLIQGETFGISLTGIQEILGSRVLTPVPRSPRDILGVCTVRGELVTVLDTASRLKVNASVSKGTGRILLTETPDGEKVGLMVDEVTGVKKLVDSEIEYTDEALVRDISPHIESIGRQEGTLTVLVNLASLVGIGQETGKT